MVIVLFAWLLARAYAIGRQAARLDRVEVDVVHARGRLALGEGRAQLARELLLEIRGVQGAGVLKTLLDRKLIAVAGRKNVIGKPILYKTTKEFLLRFGLKDVTELPSLEEFEKLASEQADLFQPPTPVA